MKAIRCTRYGPPEVLEPGEMPRPEPKDTEVLIKLHATTVTAGDCELRAFRIAGWIWLPLRIAMGLTKPRNPILGTEAAGEIVGVGSAVTRFKPGDRVFGSSSFRMGTYAQYLCLSEKAAITTIPEGTSYAEAAGIPTGGLNGLHFVRHSRVAAGEHVLINGAAGAIGMFAVQLAKNAGAEVTGVDRSDKLDMLRALGADHVIAYDEEDFTRSGTRYDVIIDVAGTSPFGASVKALKENGRYFLGNPRFWQMMRAVWTSRRGSKKVLFALAGEAVDDLDTLKRMMADGILKVMIDRTMPLEEMVDAHRYVEVGNKKGVLSIAIPQED